MAKPVTIRRVQFDAEAIAKALSVTQDVAIAKFRDGRVAGQWGEVWAASLHAFVLHGHANVAATDGAVSATSLGDLSVSVKSLTKGGVKFQQSKFQGVNRSCTQADVVSSIAASDRHLVVDITAFPTVDFLVLQATWLLGFAHKGLLTKGGWKRQRLYDELGKAGLIGDTQTLSLEGD